MTKGSVYLLLGPEIGEKEAFIQEIRNRIRSKTGKNPEETRAYVFDTSIPELLAGLRTPSLFGYSRLVLLSDLQEVKKKEDLKSLAAFCNKPAPETTLILLSEAVFADAALKKAVPPENQKIFWELFEDRKRSWVQGFFKTRERSITPEALELLLVLVENNTQELKQVCERLVSFYPAGYRITEEDIDTYIYHSKEENGFTLFAALAGRDFPTSIEILEKILLGGDSSAVALFGMLLWQFRKLLALKRLREQNYSLQEGCGKLKITSKKQQKLLSLGVENYSTLELERIISLIAEYDFSCRSMKVELQHLLIQLFIYQALNPLTTKALI